MTLVVTMTMLMMVLVAIALVLACVQQQPLLQRMSVCAAVVVSATAGTAMGRASAAPRACPA